MDQIDVNRLWQNFTDILTNHYMDFNGRVGRPQFWYYILVSFLVSVAASVIASFTTGLISTLVSLGLLLPNLGMTVRRLHDTGKPGTWVWIAAIPLGLMIVLGFFSLLGGVAGMMAFLLVLLPLVWLAALAAAIVLIYFCAQPGVTGPNQYGPEPPHWSPSAVPPVQQS
jgi:uncharacterized membrane protein YhaH (DUF805 family)